MAQKRAEAKLAEEEEATVNPMSAAQHWSECLEEASASPEAGAGGARARQKRKGRRRNTTYNPMTAAMQTVLPPSTSTAAAAARTPIDPHAQQPCPPEQGQEPATPPLQRSEPSTAPPAVLVLGDSTLGMHAPAHARNPDNSPPPAAGLNVNGNPVFGGAGAEDALALSSFQADDDDDDDDDFGFQGDDVIASIDSEPDSAPPPTGESDLSGRATIPTGLTFSSF